MAAGGLIAAKREIGFKETGTKCTVPDYPKAKLMYYLNCVKTVLKIDESNMIRLSNYENYHSLSEVDTDVLLGLVVLFSPDELIGKVFFPSDELCGDTSNNFFELSTATRLFAVSDSMVIGGQTKKVAKIMTFKMSWMEKNYLQPLRSFEGRLQRLARGLPGATPQARALPAPTSAESQRPIIIIQEKEKKCTIL